MSDSPINRLRIADSRHGYSQLFEQFNEWFEDVRRLPFGSLIKTPLDALHDVLENAIQAIERELGAIKEDQDKGSVYEACRQVDHKVIWTRRVWEHYRDKIEQRRSESLGLIVAAADEVVWSCFLPAFAANACHPQVVQSAAPLPYVEAYYTPRAFLTDTAPRDLRFHDRDFFRKCLATMPIPLVGVPTECLRRPWFLITLGHEVGHHVQHSLAPNLDTEFANEVKRSVEAVGRKLKLPYGGAPDRWHGWGNELFADLYAVAQLGEAAAWSIHEYIRTDEQRTWIEPADGAYPCPGVRQALLKHACDALSISPDPAFGDWRNEIAEPPPGHTAAIDLGLAKDVVTDLLDRAPDGYASLKAMAKESLPSGNDIETLSDHLKDQHGANPEQGEQQTRAVICAGVRALAASVNADHAEEKQANLLANLAQAIVKTRKSDVRADEPAIDTNQAAKLFWDVLQTSG